MNTTFGVRIGLGVLTAFVVIVLLASVYIIRSYDVNSANLLPSPRKLAAMVVLLEKLDVHDRGEALQALATPLMDVSVELPRWRHKIGHTHQNSATQKLLEDYSHAMPGRRLELLETSPSRPVSWIPGVVRNHAASLKLRAALASGDVLVLQPREVLPMTVLGLPIGFGAGIIGTIIALLILIFLHYQVKPLKDLANAVDESDFSHRPNLIPVVRTSAPEIRSLVRAFNRQQLRLAQLIKARLALVGGFQHDVRTFATKLRLRLESVGDPAIRERAIADLDDIVRLLDDALLATQGTDTSSEPTLEMVEISALLTADVEARDRREIKITSSAEQASPLPLYVLGDRLALRRIFANLIDNASAYGDKAEISVHWTTDTITVHVDDDGPGIPPDMRDQVLEPFVRLDPSRTRATGGSGLGLAIVANLVDQHDGKLKISEAVLGGARVTVKLPRFRSEL